MTVKRGAKYSAPIRGGYSWTTLDHGFRVAVDEKHYGPVRLRSGRVIYRNYGRPIKSPGALSAGGMMERSLMRSRSAMYDAMTRNVYSDERVLDLMQEIWSTGPIADGRRALQDATQ